MHKYMDWEQRVFLLIGGDVPGLDDDGVERIGLCQLCEINLQKLFTMDKSKRSSEIALIIIHKMLTDPNYMYRADAQNDF